MVQATTKPRVSKKILNRESQQKDRMWCGTSLNALLIHYKYTCMHLSLYLNVDTLYMGNNYAPHNLINIIEMRNNIYES